MSEELFFGFENVEIEGTSRTPYIKLNKEGGQVEIRGKSVPENTREFYWHFNRWLTEYTAQPAKKTKAVIALKYMNSSSAVVITRMLQLLDSMIGMNSEVSVEWYYEEDDLEMKHQGELYQDILRCDVKLFSVSNL